MEVRPVVSWSSCPAQWGRFYAILRIAMLDAQIPRPPDEPPKEPVPDKPPVWPPDMPPGPPIQPPPGPPKPEPPPAA